MSSGLFGRTRIVHGHGLNVRLPVAERVRAARGMKQAVVKVRSFAHGTKAVGKVMDYISQKDKLPLETESGIFINGREERRQLVRDWAVDFDKRADSRDSAHVIFSTPPGTDPEALRRAVRAVGARAFPGHEWVFAVHQNTKQPHAHMVLKMRGRDQDLKLDFRKEDLHELRSAFAEAAREQGIPLAASPRAARGVGRKGVSQAICQMRDKKILPNVWKEAMRDCMERDLAAERPWEQAMQERNKKEREFYREDAAGLRAKAAAQANENQRKALLQAAMDLERFSKAMPEPKTRRQMWLEELEEDKKKKESKLSKSQKESGWER